MAGDGLAEWLALHGVTAQQMLALIDVAPPPAPALLAPPDPPLTGETVWALAATALAAAFPDRQEVITRTRDTTSRNLSADPARFPRAFTLWEPPHVSAPSGGGSRDLLTIAHEFGHACQRQAMGQSAAMPPPILREMAACMAELALLAQLPLSHPSLHAAAQADFDAASRRTLTAGRQRLRAVLQAGAGSYHYAWNYPPARAAALAIWARADQKRSWAVFDGMLRLSELQP
jgi:hypothetical protein